MKSFFSVILMYNWYKHIRQACLCISGITLLLLAFKADRKKMITRTWHAVKLQNPQIDSIYKAHKYQIDTLGRHTDKATNLELYGTANMDSFRHALRFMLDSAMKEKMRSVKSTVFSFRADSVATISFDDVMDSCKWYFDDKDKLILSPLDTADDLLTDMHLQVVSLSDTVLKLKFTEDNTYSILTFHPERNKRPH